MFRAGLFDGARVLVTGGGTGLGRMMAERLVSLGASVDLWGRRGEVVAATAAEINARHPGRATSRAVDIKDQAAREGVWGLRQSGLNKVRIGLTSLEEINRVTVD